MKLAVMGVLLLLASASLAEDAKPPVVQGLAGTVELRTTKLEVVWVDSALDMRHLLAANGIAINADSERGFSLRGHHAETGEDVCVVYAIRPQDINDEATLVLGHEVLHCLIGVYH